MKTLGRFVHISSDTKKQVFLDWKQTYMNKTSQNTIQTPQMRYTDRKKLVSELQPLKKFNIIQKSASSSKQVKIKSVKTSASSNKLNSYVYANPQRQNVRISNFNNNQQHHRTFYRSRSMGKGFHHQNKEAILPKIFVNQLQIKQIIRQSSKLKQGKTICVITMRRSGLRFKISHGYYVFEPYLPHQHMVEKIKVKQFRQLDHKNIYLFHLSKQPINNLKKDLASKQYVIFADISPKFNLTFQLQMKLFEQASTIQDTIKKYEAQRAFIQDNNNKLSGVLIGERQSDQEESKEQRPQSQFMKRIKLQRNMIKSDTKLQRFQWQKIKNVDDYVQKMIDNPQYGQTVMRDEPQYNEIDKWCAQPYTEQYIKPKNTQQKNAFFDIRTHFPNQTTDIVGLQATLHKIQQIAPIKNVHQIKHKVIQNMMEKIKREEQTAEKLKKEEDTKIKTIGYKSGKQFFRELDHKNTLLVNQNIPFIMSKYGITRGQAYNLYNLYKSLQKISAMKYFDNNQFRRVKQKGIDRATFDQGLKNLEINPGQQVIRNICYFPQFIKWEQFIKIISISLQKTTESKLEAILEGIGSSSMGELSQNQISIMVGSSLLKIFGRQEPGLKAHFSNLVMKTLDKDNSGTISCSEIKIHVLKRGIQDLDLISYLILNS